jgi:hypothetical protein
MELFIGGGIILIYVFIVFGCVMAALGWAWHRKLSAWGVTGAILGVLFVTYAIPFGDHTIGLIKFKRVCEKESGTRIIRTVPGVEGLLSDDADGEMAQRLGYRFVEKGKNRSDVIRYEVVNDKIVKYEHVQSRSRYFLGRRTIADDGWILKGEYVITDMISRRSHEGVNEGVKRRSHPLAAGNQEATAS